MKKLEGKNPMNKQQKILTPEELASIELLAEIALVFLESKYKYGKGINNGIQRI